jgi:flagella synthesis protein FlgN
MPDHLPFLGDERTELQAFVSLLESEQRILTSENTDSLLTLAEEKSKFAHRLTAIISARRKELNDSGFGDMDTWLSHRAPQSLSIWHEIRQLAERAQHLNTVNGELIQVRMRHNLQALGVLHSAASNSAGLYGRDGQPNLSAPRRTLGTG